MKKGYNLLIYLLILCVSMTSCKPELNEKEREVIEYDIPQKLYLLQADKIGVQLGEYLTDGVADYAEILRNDLQNKIDKNNATSALFGGNAFDIGELFGTSTNEIISRQYDNYVNYVNRHMSDISEMAEGMTGRLAKHPEFISTFYDESQEIIPLDIFDGLANVPSSIRSNETDLGAITLDESDKSSWGEVLMSDYRHPHISVGAVLLASILAVESLSIPKPLYSVYDNETKSWDTGYDSGQAVSIKFSSKGDVVTYEAIPIEFQKAFINSKSNVLLRK